MVRLLNNFTLVCKKTEQGEELCSCDFRINLYGCQYSELYVLSEKILIPICALVTAMAVGFLIYFIKIKKQPFFLPASRERGWLRPRPMHSYHLIVFCYMFFQTFHMTFLVNEWYPSVMAAEFFNIMINVSTSSVAVFYTVSIVYSTPNIKLNDELLNRDGGPNTRFVDTVGIVLFILPIVTWIPLSLLTGHYAEIEDYKSANLLYTIHYLAVVLWELAYVLALAYFWHKLMTIINNYIKLIQERQLSGGSENRHVQNIRKGTRNITLPVMAMISGLSFQAIVLVVMSLTHRTITIFSFAWNLFYFWNLYISFPFIGLFVESFLIYYTITNSKKSLNNSSNYSGKPLSSSQTTQVNSEATVSHTGDKPNNNNPILCCKPILNIDDTADTSNEPPPGVIIHYTSETNTVIETIEDTTGRNVI